MQPKATLLLPSRNLASCILAGIHRDTRGTQLSDRDRVNHFPASPVVAVTKVLHGDLFLLPTQFGAPQQTNLQTLSNLFVMGPQDTPISSWSPSTLTAFTVSFYYDAWVRLGGDPEFKTIPQPVAEAFETIEIDSPEQLVWDRFGERISEVWELSSTQPKTPFGGISDWARSVSTQAALSTAGRSVRSLERFVKRNSGQTMRTLDFFSRLEDVYRHQRENPQTPLAEFAIDSGFSDQSHLGRAVRRLTGFSPAKLNKAIETEEPFWCYRLLGERF